MHHSTIPSDQQRDQPKLARFMVSPRSSSTRLCWVALALAASSALAHPSRQLSLLTESSGIRFTVSARAEAGTMDAITMEGIAIPRNCTASDGGDDRALLEFDGRLAYQFLGRAFSFTLVNGRGYQVTTDLTTGKLLQNECLQPGSVVPLSTITDALQSARVVTDKGSDSGSSTGLPDCDGTLLELQFANEPYLICTPHVVATMPPSSGSTDGSGDEEAMDMDALVDDDLHAAFQFLRARSSVTVGDTEEEDLQPPTLDELTRPEGKSIDECPLLTTTANESVNDEDEDEDEESAVEGHPLGRGCDTSCSHGKKICLFVQGLGKGTEAPLADEYNGEWGDMHTKLSCCSESKFLRMDTANNAWYSDALVDKVCGAALNLTQSADPMQLENLVILAHSMGNLVVANAAMQQACAIGASSKWIALAPPMRGSTAANLAVSVCEDDSSVLDDPKVALLEAIGLCPAKGTVASLVYEGSRESNDDLDALYQQAETTMAEYVSAAMCGVDAVGLMSKDSFKYGPLSLVAGHASHKNDGAVEFASCRGLLDAKQFSSSWNGGAFYRAAINHGDTTGRNGDGWWGNDRKPVKWMNCQI